jgi:KaiC/GvpD/RAD55 family RecA-like ATPase
LNIYDTLSRAVKEMNAKRLVIDSISVLEMFIHDKYLARVAIMNLIEMLRELEVTTLMTGEIPETEEGLSGSGIIEYLVDTVIKLDFVPVAEEFKRTLTIRKMRRTNHSTLIHPFEITPRGWKIIEIE